MKLYRSKKAMEGILATYDELLAAWGVDVRERDIATPYGQTHVVCCGDEVLPPLVLLHGVGDDAALMWVYNAKELSRHFCLYAIDAIGGPGKSRPDDRYDAGFDDSHWLDAVLEGLGIENASFVGVSHGAYVAQTYLIERPRCTARAVCISGTVPAWEGDPMRTMMKIFLPEALFPTKANTEKLLRKLSGDHHAALTGNPAILRHYRFLLQGFNNGAMRFHKLKRFSKEQIEGIRDRTLYLMGEVDPFATLGGKELLNRYGMNARFYKNAGHGLNHELHDEINAAIIGFLA